MVKRSLDEQEQVEEFFAPIGDMHKDLRASILAIIDNFGIDNMPYVLTLAFCVGALYGFRVGALAATMCEEFGNPAKRAERELVQKLDGDQLLHRESHTLKLEAMRSELARPDSTPLEKLLVERVLVCWLQVYHADIAFYAPKTMPAVQGEYGPSYPR